MTYKYAVDGENLTLTEEESGTELKYKRVEAVPTEAADPNATENGSKLVGDWEGEQNGVTVVYTFNANGTGVMKGGSATVNFNYTDDGSNVTLSTDGEDGSTAPYTIEGDTLKVTPEDSEEFTLTRKQ